MWGSNRCFDGPKGGAVTDEDLQAQAWLPTCLMSMLVEVRALSSSPVLRYPTLMFSRPSCVQLQHLLC